MSEPRHIVQPCPPSPITISIAGVRVTIEGATRVVVEAEGGDVEALAAIEPATDCTEQLGPLDDEHAPERVLVAAMAQELGKWSRIRQRVVGDHLRELVAALGLGAAVDVLVRVARGDDSIFAAFESALVRRGVRLAEAKRRASAARSLLDELRAHADSTN